MMIMSKFKWIFFDLDGTLADSINIMYEIYDEFLKEYGFRGNQEEFKKLNGPSISEIVSYLKNKYKLNIPIENLIKNYENKIRVAYTEKVKPQQGSTKLLKLLQDNDYKLALVTSSSGKIVKSFLKKNHWNDFFSVIVSGDEIGKSKPESEIYEFCLNRSGANKNDVLVVEDSENGFKSAKAAGLECIIINNNTKKLEDILTLLN